MVSQKQITSTVVDLGVAPGYELENLRSNSSRNQDDSRHTIQANTKLMSRLKTTKGWTPFILSRIVLIGFILFFASCFAALEVMYRISASRQGLATQDDRNHYFWTYGPTAVFTIILSFWSLLDFRVRELAPWAALAKGPVSASKSLLVDYTSPFFGFVLVAAARNRHYLPVFTITGYMMLKLIVILSTGLFILQPQDMVNPLALVKVHDDFSALNITHGFVDNYSDYSVYGNIALNLPYVSGTTAQYAIQTFTHQDTPETSTKRLTVLVDAFTADLTCETGNLTSTSGYFPNGTVIPGDDPIYTCTGTSGCEVSLDNEDWVADYKRSYWGQHGYINCTTAHDSSDNGMRFSIALVEIIDARMTNSACVICKPNYFYQQAQVTVDGNSSNVNSTLFVEPIPGSQQKVIPEISQEDFAQFVSDSFALLTRFSLPNLPADTFWNLLLVQEPKLDVTAFLNTTILLSRSRELYTAKAVHLAKQFLTTPANIVKNGSAIYSQQRLYVRGLSLRWMQASLILMILLTILIEWICQRNVVSDDPRTLETLAAILAASPQLKKRLLREPTPYQTSSSLAKGLYHTTTTINDKGVPTFSIEINEVEPLIQKDGNSTQDMKIVGHIHDDARDKSHVSKSQTWWNPLMLRLPSVAGTILLLVAILVVLETMFHLSKIHSGIAHVSLDDYSRYIWLYIPASVMFVASSLITAFQFAILTIQPYHILKQGGVPAEKSIQDRSRGDMSLAVLAHASKTKSIGIFTATIAALLVSTLAIVVSGLYTSSLTPLSISLDVTRLDHFNSSWSVNDDNNIDRVVVPLVASGNLSYPPWTYSEVVLPTLGLSSQDNRWNFSEPMESFLNIDVPALRADVNCTNVSASDFNLTFTTNTTGFFNVIALIHYDGGSSKSDLDEIQVVSPGYIGRITNLVRHDSAGVQITAFGLVYGYISNSTDLPHNFTLLHCQPFVEQVNTNVNFLLPKFSIDPQKPPAIDESTAQFFGNQVIPGQNLTNFATPSSVYTSQVDLGNANEWLGYLLEENTPSELMEPEILINALQHQYRIVMAQVLNYNVRVNTSASEFPGMKGTVSTYQLRLMQNVLSTRLLQGILGTCVLLIFVTWFFIHPKNLLPQEPGNLATIFGLLVRQEVVTRTVIPEGSEWRGAEKWSNGYVFSLGWWSDEESREKHFGIGVGKAETE